MKILEEAKKRCKNPIKLSWRDVRFEVEVLQNEEEMKLDGRKTRRQMIVKDATGYAAPGIATYIMGASGAGKTSLLNILSDRVVMINKAKLSGTITFNDTIPLNQETFARYAAYVMQDDVLFSHFTVVEALTFCARLKLTTPDEEQDKDVSRIIKELGLWHVKDSQIGDIRRKILSGGERKRTSIGVELVSDPSLIMLDEPTSGLDSFKARSICKLLNDLARMKGRTIVSTIHQPSSEAFFYFDRIYLMADGFTVFQGDAAESMDWFRALKFQVPKRCNPADFFMKALSIKYPKQKDDTDKLDLLNRTYKFQLAKRIDTENSLIKLDPPADYAAGAKAYKANMYIQLNQLMYRSWTLAQREPRISRAKIVQTIIIAAFLIPTFWQLNDFINCDPIARPVDKTETECKQLNAVEFHSMIGAMYFLCVM
jgi:ATP-binding cassette, subfamily G (WHITE), eye pigment precursor transporter